MDAVSTPWASPDAQRTVTGTAFGRTYERVEPVAPPLAQDVRAGFVTLAVTVLLGAPVGLLWARLAPEVEVVVMGDRLRLADPYSDGQIAVDGYFLAAVLLAGLVGGLLAWRLAARHGPAVVTALAVGGLAAAYVARVVGETYALQALRTSVRAGGDGTYPGLLELNSIGMLAGWPVASLLAYLALAFTRGR